ncbi:MAG: A/G-specific adenine glycosylase [Bifidobacteriaceae bacterium]|nr:A/G-specific adenine glycosylase [Bifidobacteriaceae bacterium]
MNTQNQQENIELTPEVYRKRDEISQRLAQWWCDNARELPWRFGRTTPWGILVCEVMSQQTQMSRVVPYWNMWMQQWPTPQDLAQASTAEVLSAWGRLGYPRRALRLQECASVIAHQYDNKVPDTYDELLKLPGIGDYTASAVLSFAYSKRISVIDTNIRRVISRALLGKESFGGSATSQERLFAQKILPQDKVPQVNATQDSVAQDALSQNSKSNLDSTVVGSYTVDSNVVISRQNSVVLPSVMWNQSIMELGAVVCSASAPDCDHCPLRHICEFNLAGKPRLGVKRTRPRQHFKGTNRQVRGIVMQALRESDQGFVTREYLESLWKNTAQLHECIASLDEDGLVQICDDNLIRFP